MSTCGGFACHLDIGCGGNNGKTQLRMSSKMLEQVGETYYHEIRQTDNDNNKKSFSLSLFSYTYIRACARVSD